MCVTEGKGKGVLAGVQDLGSGARVDPNPMTSSTLGLFTYFWELKK